ncbi:hypothetical protein EON62_00135 [archaeon]|nr:MAG: hypothetical protein EON62_00135 [archaeon]
MSSGAHKISVALDVCVARDAAQCLADATRSGFDFIALPLFHPRYTRDGLPHVSAARTGPGTRTDTTLTAEEWASCVVGKVSPWIDLDHACASIVTASEKGLKTELAWASHLGGRCCTPCTVAACARTRARGRVRLLLSCAARHVHRPCIMRRVLPRAVPAVMLPALRHGDNANLARHVNQVVQSSCGMHFWVTLPLVDASVRILPPTGALASITECAAGAVTDADDVYLPAAGPAESGAPEEVDALQLRLRFQSTPLETESLGTTTTAGATAAVAAAPVSDAGAGSTSDELAPANDPWQWWATFRALCEHHPNVSCALELSAELPSQRHLHRWLCEPIKAAIIPTSLFVMNAAGYPVLSRRHQYFIQSLLSHKVQFLLRGRPDPSFMTPGTDACGGLQRYVEYITHILRKVPTLTEQEQFEAPFLDYLQAPLQPLMDNLESQTYEVFERDPIKYQQYELAIQRALEDTSVDKVSVLMIVGAGRGPIVKRALTAAELAGRTVRVYAIEKNPNAIITYVLSVRSCACVRARTHAPIMLPRCLIPARCVVVAMQSALAAAIRVEGQGAGCCHGHARVECSRASRHPHI